MVESLPNMSEEKKKRPRTVLIVDTKSYRMRATRQSKININLRLNSKSVGNHWVLVAHPYNPSYSGGRDQEDWGSETAQAISS
jgi:hypothetical protein